MVIVCLFHPDAETGFVMPPDTMPIASTEIAQAVAALKQGGLVAFPTETVYGLGADADNAAALARLYAVKGRPKAHPVIVHVAHRDQLSDWAVDIPETAWRLADAFWPGSLTLILPRAARVLDAVTGGQDTVGLRVPAHPVALSLLQAFGGGIAAPSANRFGRISPTTAGHVQADLGKDVDYILDGGACPVGVESTIVAFQEGQPVVLRPGMITAAQLEAALSPGRPSGTSCEMPSAVSHALVSASVRVPGALKSHYAPRTPLRIYPPSQLMAECCRLQAQGLRVGVMALGPCPETLHAWAEEGWVQMPQTPEAYAQKLYATLHALDAKGLGCILAESVPETEAWMAIADRLGRAAAV